MPSFLVRNHYKEASRRLVIIAVLLLTAACLAVPTGVPTESGQGGQATAPASIPAPTATQIDRANIYLIALEDNGQSGKKIGCNDSVVAVEVEIEPTGAPLRAALEALLAIDSRYYDQSELYNALYDSDLRVEDIDIVDGEATINLSGELRMGGVCDAPRFEAQILETALQFPTVERASVFLNGEPLREIISQQ